MVNSGEKLSDNELFKKAVSFAKGIAKFLDKKELDPTLFLAGVIKALEDKNFKKKYPEIVKNLENISEAISKAGLNIPDTISPDEETKFPPTRELKKSLSNQEITIAEYIQSLLEILNSVKKIDLPEYHEIIHYASAIAKLKENKNISVEIFSAAAYLAYIQGKFTGHQALSIYFSSNFFEFEELLKIIAVDSNFFPQTVQEIYLVCDDLQDILKNSDLSNLERIFGLLNLGLSKSKDHRDRVSTAYHEASHAVVAATLRTQVTVSEVTIVPNKNESYAGRMSYEGSNLFLRPSSREAQLAEICVYLAGRSGELIKYGGNSLTTGATADITTATHMAWRSVTCLGFDDEFGPLDLRYISENENVNSGWLFDLAQRRVHELIMEAAKRTEAILRANWDQVESVVKDLLIKGALDALKFSEDLVFSGLSSMLGSKEVRSIPVERKIKFQNLPGIVASPEGPVRFDKGDALAEDSDGSVWPIGRSYLEKNYKPAEGIIFGQDGVYTKQSRTVIALELTENRRVDLSKGRGILLGEVGDWLIDYGGGEVSVVNKERFDALYVIP